MQETKLNKSADLFEKAQQLFPGGVNSPVRAFKAVGGSPFFVQSAKGSGMTTEEGKELIDYIQSWGASILGHAAPSVVQAIQKQAPLGTSYGACHEQEILLAEKIKAFFPSIEKLRFSNSGTEAVMSVIRLARGVTRGDKIIKVEGGYHGHSDSLLVKAGSGATTFGVPDSAGIPADLAQHTLTVGYNDIEGLKKVLTEYQGEIACFIVEPVPGNMGVIQPKEGYLQEVRTLTQEAGVLLIFDEVMSGFRVSRGGAQELFNVQPDLTVLGKIIGGGLPVSAFGGKEGIMDHLAPLGPVYQAGTLAGNPLAMVAGQAVLEALDQPDFYVQLEKVSAQLEEGILNILAQKSLPYQVNRVGSMITLFFLDQPVRNFQDAKASDTKKFAKFFQNLLSQGILIPPSQFESWFVSIAHSSSDIEATLKAIEKGLNE